MFRKKWHEINIYRRYINWKKAKCIFVHVPKAAGTSINFALYGRTLGHYTIEEIQSHFPKLVARLFVFSFVRNPYDRLVSAYHFAKIGRTKDMGIFNPQQYQIPEFETFERFVTEWLSRQELSAIDHVFRPQNLYVCIDGKVALDYLGRLETISDDLAAINKRLNKTIVLDKKNVTARERDYRNYYNSELAEIVYRLYKDDFELLGYKREL